MSLDRVTFPSDRFGEVGRRLLVIINCSACICGRNTRSSLSFPSSSGCYRSCLTAAPGGISCCVLDCFRHCCQGDRERGGSRLPHVFYHSQHEALQGVPISPHILHDRVSRFGGGRWLRCWSIDMPDDLTTNAPPVIDIFVFRLLFVVLLSFLGVFAFFDCVLSCGFYYLMVVPWNRR